MTFFSEGALIVSQRLGWEVIFFLRSHQARRVYDELARSSLPGENISRLQ